MEESQNHQINLNKVQTGVFRRLPLAERESFFLAGERAYTPGGTTQIDPYHHPMYRLGLAKKAVAQARAECVALDKQAEHFGTN